MIEIQPCSLDTYAIIILILSNHEYGVAGDCVIIIYRIN